MLVSRTDVINQHSSFDSSDDQITIPHYNQWIKIFWSLFQGNTSHHPSSSLPHFSYLKDDRAVSGYLQPKWCSSPSKYSASHLFHDYNIFTTVLLLLTSLYLVFRALTSQLARICMYYSKFMTLQTELSINFFQAKECRKNVWTTVTPRALHAVVQAGKLSGFRLALSCGIFHTSTLSTHLTACSRNRTPLSLPGRFFPTFCLPRSVPLLRQCTCTVAYDRHEDRTSSQLCTCVLLVEVGSVMPKHSWDDAAHKRRRKWRIWLL